MHLANYQQLDEAVYLWFVQKRSEGLPALDLFCVRKQVNFLSVSMGIVCTQFSKQAMDGCGTFASVMDLKMSLHPKRAWSHCFWILLYVHVGAT